MTGFDSRLSRRAFAALALAAPAAARAQQDAGFAAWLRAFRAEARARGIAERVLDEAFDGVEPIERVIELDRRQPESRLTTAEYLGRVVTQARVRTAVARLREHGALLRPVGERFGVPPRFIVALWGIESDFGRLTGGFPVVAALATLAHEGRRAAFFRGELFNALTILQQGHIAARDMRGSWAGAMGQCQFMPSSFLNFAVDQDGDGRKDIWTSLPDVFGSIANYLSRSGWQSGGTWGRAVRLPTGFDRALTADTRAELQSRARPLAHWTGRGVRRADGGALPLADMSGAVIEPDGAAGPAYLAYANFRVIMAWNSSFRFALAVGTLADRIEEAGQ